MVFLRAIIFTILVPGTVIVAVPIVLLQSGYALGMWPGLRVLGLFPIAVGVGVYLWCGWDFAAAGKGTPAPYDPPSLLVTRGLYKFVRNPIYVAIVLIIAGEALLFDSLTLLGYAVLLLTLFHFRVVFFEEPRLRRKFGEAYDEYCGAVPRWLPRRRER